MYEMYIIQGIMSGAFITEELSVDDETQARLLGKGMLKSPTFEGDSVRIITRDGEMVWDSKDQSD